MTVLNSKMGQVLLRNVLAGASVDPVKEPEMARLLETVRNIKPGSVTMQTLTFDQAVDALRNMSDAVAIRFLTMNGEIHSVIVL